MLICKGVRDQLLSVERGVLIVRTSIISLVYTCELSQKFNFQFSTTKPDYEGHPIVEIGQV